MSILKHDNQITFTNCDNRITVAPVEESNHFLQIAVADSYGSAQYGWLTKLEAEELGMFLIRESGKLLSEHPF